MQNKKFLPEFPGKFGIFTVILKTIIRIKGKPKNWESATYNPLLKSNLQKCKKKISPGIDR